MTKLELETIENDEPVNRMVEFPNVVYRDLTAFAEVLARAGSNATAPDPIKLVVPMLQCFMATDKAFRKARTHDPFDRVRKLGAVYNPAVLTPRPIVNSA